MVKAQDSYALSFSRKKDGKHSVSHYLCEKVVGEGYYYSGGKYEDTDKGETFIFSKRSFFPTFYDLLEFLLRNLKTTNITNIADLRAHTGETLVREIEEMIGSRMKLFRVPSENKDEIRKLLLGADAKRNAILDESFENDLNSSPESIVNIDKRSESSEN